MKLQAMHRPLLALTVVLTSLVLITALSGCVVYTGSSQAPSSIFVYARQPVYEMPENVVLSNVPSSEMMKLSPEYRAVIEKNFQVLTTRVVELEAIIKTHNEYAKRMNETSGIYKSALGDVGSTSSEVK